MDSDSIKCLKFINKNKLIKKLNLSPESKNYMDSVIKIIKNTDKKYNYREENQQIHDRLKFLINQDPFVPFDNREEALKNIICKQCYHENGNKKIKINYFDDKKDNLNINEIIHICYIVSGFIKLDQFNIELNVFPSNAKKKISRKGKVLGPENINSGSCIAWQYINIWRREELIKVLFHELMHFFQVDFYFFEDTNRRIENYFQQKFSTNANIKTSEIYAECCGIFLNSCYAGYKINATPESVLAYELNFSLFQAAKILNYYQLGHDYYKYFTKVTETTAVLSYFILKSIALLQTDKLIKFISKGPKFNDRIDDFLKLYENMDQEYIKKYIPLVKNEPQFVYQTLRMSCFSFI